MKTVLVPYHHAESLPALARACPHDDAVIVANGPPGAMVARLYDRTAAWIASHDEPIVVASGDCTTALATVAGLQRRGLEPSAIWLDAHGDFHTPHTTRSGYLGGMALAMLVGRCGTALSQAIGLRPLAEDRCALIGARDLDPGEREALDASAVRPLNLPALSDGALPRPPWYVHLDVDVLDPAALPPLRFPVPDGPFPDAVGAALRALARRGTIVALGLACTLTPQGLAQDGALANALPLVDAALAG